MVILSNFGYFKLFYLKLFFTIIIFGYFMYFLLL